MLALYFILLLLALPSSSSAPVDSIIQNISIQTTNETFYSYIPLSSDCTYPNQSSVELGHLQYTPLDPPAIFDSVSLTAQVTFWSPLVNGLRMQLDANQLLSNGTYSQVVPYNSSINQNLTQRELILTNFTPSGHIIFNYANPVYNYTSNTLTPAFTSNTYFDLGNEIAQIVRDCTESGTFIWVAYAGEDNFVGVCPTTTNIFIWNVNNNSEPYVYDQLSFLEGNNIQNITNNPTLFLPIVPNSTFPLPKKKNYDWNIVLLLQGGTSAFFCQANSTSLLCESYQNQQNWVQIVIQRGWGLQASLQLSQIQLILAQFPQLLNQTFPGNIVSIFSYSSTLFIESSSDGTTYLCIFQSGRILANTSLTGQIIYFGRENLIIQQQDGSFFMVDFILPIYQIVHEDPQQKNQTLNISCTFTTYQLAYDIVWSNIAFPMYLVQQLSTIPTVSYQSVKAANLDDFFMIIGPAFNLFIELDAGIEINLLDISDMLGFDQILDVVSVLFTQGNGHAYVPYIIIFLDERGILKQYRIGSHLPALSCEQPCRMGKIDQCFTLKHGFVFTSGERICYCGQDLENCQTISPESLPGIVAQQTSSLGEYSFTLSSIIDQISPLSSSPTPNGESPIKKQLLGIVDEDLIINIYQNNTIALTNFRQQLKDSLSPLCLQYNTTDGTIFVRNFYDDFLLVYCYGRGTIAQYLIRNQQLVFNRAVPLYGFLTTNSSSGILPGQNYVFLQVKLNPEYLGTIKPKANGTSCCILRLDPDQFTVSVIAEIIMGTKLITVQSMYGVDVVFYNSTEVEGAVPMIKVYFDSSWITFSQNTRCTPQNSTCTPVTYPYSIALISDFYNFAAAFNLFIEFNISASVISFTGAGIHDVSLEMYTGRYTFYNSSVNYSFNSFCGPISSFHQQSTISEAGSIFLITENDIVTESKELTNSYQPVLQVIDLGEQAPGTTLGQCIVTVGLQNLTFYLKYNLTWMSELTVVDSPSPNCLYFINKILNSTAVQLGSYCYNPNANTPTITINYHNQTSAPTVSFGQMQMPMQLRNVVSVLQQNQTLLTGIQQGPSKSVSGVLFLCNISICNSLTIWPRVVFFIDFDQQLTSNGLVIIGLDIYIVSIWLNPTLSSNSSVIQTNHTINYHNILGYSCSKVTIVSASPTAANVILSCPSGLQQIILNYGPTASPPISQVMTFSKFANCEAIDRFKPEFILKQGTTSIQFLAVQCQQSVDIVRIQEIYSLNSNNSLPIVTGYLMIYTSNGPQCSPNVWNPVRMIDLGTSQESSPYNIYFANGHYKLLYGQINGILIDSFISTQPNTYYELIKLQQHINYPSILMSVKNPYYEIKLMIDTAPQKIPTPPVVRYLIIAIFVFFNATTVAFLLCWCLFRKHVSRHRNRLFEASMDAKIIINSPSRLNPAHFVSDQDSVYSSEYPKAERGGTQMEQRPSMLRPSNAGNQRKRKGTEIQLFQPR